MIRFNLIGSWSSRFPPIAGVACLCCAESGFAQGARRFRKQEPAAAVPIALVVPAARNSNRRAATAYRCAEARVARRYRQPCRCAAYRD